MILNKNNKFIGLTSLDDLCMDTLEIDKVNRKSCNILVYEGFLDILKELK